VQVRSFNLLVRDNNLSHDEFGYAMISHKENNLSPKRLALFAIATAIGSTLANAQSQQAIESIEKKPGAIIANAEPVRADQRFLPGPQPDAFTSKLRVFVLTDIGNEPDDQMSFVRLLVYANEIDIEGVAAVTSTWLKTKPNPAVLHNIIDAYADVLPNLEKHAKGWPGAEKLHAAISTGPQAYGLAAANTLTPSPATQAFITAADRADNRPLWISIWGGANVLAEALEVVRRTRSPDELNTFLSKLRVYSISDQDDAGPWIRREFPKLQYIVSPSLPTSDEYGAATWTGISGDIFYANGQGADGTTVTNEWLDTHIRKGPLGAHYPKFEYIMEGDTPAFLGLIPNGLNSAMSPAWGGWGGRYIFRRPYGESHPVWTQSSGLLYGVNSRDRVIGNDGHTYSSDQATIWRWRNAFQNDFAARMDWTVKSHSEANHSPIPVVNGDRSRAPLFVEMKIGTTLVLDASQSEDPDAGQNLRYRWFYYPEAGATLGALTDVAIEGADSARATISATNVCRPMLPGLKAKCQFGTAHVILEVTDDGNPKLTSYRRVVVKVRQ
jgi:hypothetical protein